VGVISLKDMRKFIALEPGLESQDGRRTCHDRQKP
jgi:hypothetical protein